MMKIDDSSEALSATPVVQPDPSLFAIDGLDFALPEFFRISWVSDLARKMWEPRFKRIAVALSEVEWFSVASGLRSCCVTESSSEDIFRHSRQWQRLGLSALPLEPERGSDLGAKLKYVLGKSRDLNRFLDLEEISESNSDISLLLGVPHCCYEFQRYIWVDLGFSDPTWPVAVMTGQPASPVRSIDLSSQPLTNFFWKKLGLSVIPHLPCSLNCSTTIGLAEQITDLANTSGYDTEIKWLLEILDWPLSWSCLHGIAEVKTPVLKYTCDSIATAGKYEINYVGNVFPEHGAKGLGFPFKVPQRPILSSSSGFRRGMDNPILPIIEA